MKKLLLLVLLAAVVTGSTPATANDAFEAPVPVRMVPPKYPVEMRKEGTGGLVTVKVTIDEKGNVTEPVVEKTTHDAFVQPALDALRKWKFKPAKRDGAVVAMKVSIPIQFSMSDD
jgi:protein TonB